MDYLTKINDFKQIMNEIVNPENDKDKKEVIEALFDNVLKNYEDYKDTIPLVSVYYEPYEYHIIQPVNGFYTLLDFLLNRAISNLEKINLSDRGVNSHSNHLEININLNRYSKMAMKKSRDIVEKHYKKSKYHETLHLLHGKFRNENGCFFSNDDELFRKKVNYFYQKLSSKYSNILNPNELNNVKCNKFGNSLTKPFELSGWSSTSLAIDEFSTEMEAILNSGLIKIECDWCKLDDNYYQFLPNFNNGYANFQIFSMQFKSLVAKLQYFGSVFFHTSSAIDEFVRLYSNQILSNSSKWNKDGNALNTFCCLFKDAIVGIQYNINKFEVYETLSRIFIQIYNDKLNNIEHLDNDILELYKKTFALSYNQSPFKIINGKCEKTWIGETYWNYYNIVCKELERRNNSEKSTKL